MRGTAVDVISPRGGWYRRTPSPANHYSTVPEPLATDSAPPAWTGKCEVHRRLRPWPPGTFRKPWNLHLAVRAVAVRAIAKMRIPGRAGVLPRSRLSRIAGHSILSTAAVRSRARHDRLVAGLAPAGVRPCRAHTGNTPTRKASGWIGSHLRTPPGAPSFISSKTAQGANPRPHTVRATAPRGSNLCRIGSHPDRLSFCTAPGFRLTNHAQMRSSVRPIRSAPHAAACWPYMLCVATQLTESPPLP